MYLSGSESAFNIAYVKAVERSAQHGVNADQDAKCVYIGGEY